MMLCSSTNAVVCPTAVGCKQSGWTQHWTPSLIKRSALYLSLLIIHWAAILHHMNVCTLIWRWFAHSGILLVVQKYSMESTSLATLKPTWLHRLTSTLCSWAWCFNGMPGDPPKREAFLWEDKMFPESYAELLICKPWSWLVPGVAESYSSGGLKKAHGVIHWHPKALLYSTWV